MRGSTVLEDGDGLPRCIEFQARGLRHVHTLIRFNGSATDDTTARYMRKYISKMAITSHRRSPATASRTAGLRCTGLRQRRIRQ
jgi:hypothetical protein